ncbi:MAG: DUF1566 domain-containing protein [Methylococcales bacterium]|nr:DUF1566 domain-containing protein [Methylococcales bacterium]
MIGLFSMVVSFVSSFAERAMTDIMQQALPDVLKDAPLSDNERELSQLRSEMESRQQDVELKKRELELRAKISADNLRLMQQHHVENIDLKLKEIQANYDAQHWQGILSRDETIEVLKQGQQKNRFLILLSPPDVSPSCPLTFQHDLGKTLRSKVKEFVEIYYPHNSDFPVQFFGKFFKSTIFDTEAAQLESLLSPIPTAVIFSDLTNKELLLHVHVWGMMGGKISLSSSFEWKSEYKKLLAAGNDEEDALDEIQDAIVQTHKLLGGFLTDLYFLQMNPFYEPQLFKMDKVVYPAELTAQLLSQLQNLQQQRRVEYEQLLLNKGQQKTVSELPKDKQINNLVFSEHTVIKEQFEEFIIIEGEDAVAIDTITGLIWMRLALGQNWENNTAVGFPESYSDMETVFLIIEEINNLCNGDWRLPTIDELKTLIDKNKNSEDYYINANAFPNHGYFTYLSSTEHHDDEIDYEAMAVMGLELDMRAILTVDFSDGSVAPIFPAIAMMSSVRLVRSIN